MSKTLDPTKLLAKIRDLENQNTSYFCPFLDGEIKVVRLPFEKALEHYEAIQEAKSILEIAEASMLLVYEACPLFKDESLRKNLDNIVEPMDTVKAVYQYDIEAVANLAIFILKQYGLSIIEEDRDETEAEEVEELKN